MSRGSASFTSQPEIFLCHSLVFLLLLLFRWVQVALPAKILSCPKIPLNTQDKKSILKRHYILERIRIKTFQENNTKERKIISSLIAYHITEDLCRENEALCAAARRSAAWDT